MVEERCTHRAQRPARVGGHDGGYGCGARALDQNSCRASLNGCAEVEMTIVATALEGYEEIARADRSRIPRDAMERRERGALLTTIRIEQLKRLPGGPRR
jgi:hypothetical protein